MTFSFYKKLTHENIKNVKPKYLDMVTKKKRVRRNA